MEEYNENTPLKESSSLELNPVRNDALAPPLNIVEEGVAAATATDIGDRIPDPLPVNEWDRESWLGCLCILTTIAVIVLFFKWLSHVSAISSPDFQVKSLSFSSFNLSTCEITARWNISFHVKNPKKGANVFYDGIRVFLLYNDEFISATDTASFYQGIRQQLFMNATLGLGGSPVKVNPWIVSAIEADKNLRKGMILSVVVDARVSRNPGSTYQERLWLKVFCDNIEVAFLAETDKEGSIAAAGAGTCIVKL